MAHTALKVKSKLKYTTTFVVCCSLLMPLSLMFIVAPRLMPLVNQNAFPIIIEICFWAMALVVLVVVLCWERQSLRSIGFRRFTWSQVLLALALSIVLCLLVPILAIFMQNIVGVPTRTINTVQALAQLPIWLRILLAIRPAVVEEILYRGYPIERLNHLTGRIWPGSVISLIIFTVIHMSSGLGNTIGVVLPIGVILTVLYVWKRNLTLNIVVHFLTDSLVLVLLPLLPSIS